MTVLSHILGGIVCILASGCGSGWQHHRFWLWILWASSTDGIRYKCNHLNSVGENRNCWAQLLRKGGAAYQGATFSVTSTVTPLTSVNSIEICDGVRGEVQLWIPHFLPAFSSRVAHDPNIPPADGFSVLYPVLKAFFLFILFLIQVYLMGSSTDTSLRLSNEKLRQMVTSKAGPISLKSGCLLTRRNGLN